MHRRCPLGGVGDEITLNTYVTVILKVSRVLYIEIVPPGT